MSISLNPKDVKALALDLDGTVLGPGSVLSDRTVRAVKRCIQRGIRIIIATGRAIEAVEPFRLALGAEGPMIYYNGVVVAEKPGNKILNITLLDKKAAEFCAELARDMGVYCQVYLSGNADDPREPPPRFDRAEVPLRMPLMTELDGPEREMYYKHTGILAELGNLEEALARPELQGCVKVMFLAEPEVQAALRPKIDERLGKSIYVAQTYRTFLEVMDAKASKGQGLKFIMGHCSLKNEEVIAFGDEENDLPMFAAAGFSVAPSNAKDTVKAQAGLVVGSNAEDGVAAFLEEFFGL